MSMEISDLYNKKITSLADEILLINFLEQM